MFACSALTRGFQIEAGLAPPQKENPVEVAVVAADITHFDGAAHCCVQGIAGREALMAVQQPSCFAGNLSSDGHSVAQNSPGQIVNVAPVSPTVYRPVSMQDFLKNFGVDEGVDLPRGNFVGKLLTRLFVRMGPRRRCT